MTTPEQIHKALGSLDVANDNHWTGDGLPRLDTVKMLAGDQSITRDAVTLAAPGFTRASAAQHAAAPPPVAPAPVAETAAGAPPAVADPEVKAPVAPPVQSIAPTGLPAGVNTLAPGSSPSPLSLIPFVDNTDVLAAKVEELTMVDAQIAEINSDLASINKQKADLVTRADDLRLQIDKLTPRDSNQQAIGGYLESQKRILEGRGRQQAALRNLEGELGIRIADMLPKRAPIDAAMARKLGHGGQRPK